MSCKKNGRPRAERCRFCDGAGELLHGAHRSCLYKWQTAQKSAKKGGNRCSDCGCAAGYRRRFCDKCRDRRRKQTQARKDAQRAPRVRVPKQPTAPKPRTPKPVKPPTPPRVYVKRERPFAEPRKAIIDQPPTNPRGVEPRRIAPVGAAAWSAADARRWG